MSLESSLTDRYRAARHRLSPTPKPVVVTIPPPAAGPLYEGSPERPESTHAVIPTFWNMESPAPRFPSVSYIQSVVCLHYQLTLAQLLSERRHRNIVRPRQIAMYLAKTLTPRSLPEIGRRFGGRDHTTVLHAIRKVAALMDEDRDFARGVETVQQAIVEASL